MDKRKIIISHCLPPTKKDDTTIWIQVTKEHSSANCIRTAMRMKPDEIIIKQDCFGTFTIS